MEDRIANVIGAGLAGCEAAYQLARRGVKVRLYEMKPLKRIPAHSTDLFCELCCSNSLRAEGLTNAVGVLKQELRRLGSLIIECADATRVPAGGALAVDREKFAEAVTDRILSHPNIEVVRREVTDLDFAENTVVATGPLTSGALAQSIKDFFGRDYLSFFDAAAPIVAADSVDMSRVFAASRYGKGTPDYINCPMDEREYEAFYQALVTAETVPMHGFEDDKVFEGCMPVEVMARRGHDTLLFGPLKPVGLSYPGTNLRPKAVVQLRKDNLAETLYNIVGFQTHLTFGEQRRVFSMIPGLEHAEFVRYGVMHRNTFINSPGLLSDTYETLRRRGLFFAGQMTGVEGYVESAASGYVAGVNADPARLTPIVFDPATAIGALARYISHADPSSFQPMNVNFGLFPPLQPQPRKVKRADRKLLLAQRALDIISEMDI